MPTNISHIVESTTRLVLEDRGSKNLSQARAYLEKSGVQDPQKVIDTIRHDIPNIRLPRKDGRDTYKFLFAACRYFTEQAFSDADAIMQFNSVLPYIASGQHVENYDRNLNNLPLSDIINQFAGIKKQDIDAQKAQSQSNSFGKSDYKVVPIDSFEEAEKYSDYTTWCVTKEASNYNNYTHGRRGRFYFCLKNGFENVPQEVGENCPLDEYGLSMIAVSINQDGSPNTITCRWNHANGGNDSVMTPQQLEQVIQMPYYETFKPFTEEELANRDVSLTYEEYSEIVFDNSFVILAFTDKQPVYWLMQDLSPNTNDDHGYDMPDREAHDYSITDDENRNLSGFEYGRDSLEARVDGVFAVLKPSENSTFRSICLAYDDQGNGDIYEWIKAVDVEYSTEHQFIVFYYDARYDGRVIWNTLDNGGFYEIKNAAFIDLRVIDNQREVNSLVEIRTSEGYTLIDLFTSKIILKNRLPKNGVGFEFEWIDDDEYTGWVVDTEDGMRVTAEGDVLRSAASKYPVIWSGNGIKLIENNEDKQAYLPLGSEDEPELWFDKPVITYEQTDGRYSLVGIKKSSKDNSWTYRMIGEDCKVLWEYGEPDMYASMTKSAFGHWFALRYTRRVGVAAGLNSAASQPGEQYVKFFHKDLSPINVELPINGLRFYNDFCIGFTTKSEPDLTFMFSLKDGHLLIPEGTLTNDTEKERGTNLVRIKNEKYNCATERFLNTEGVRRLKQRFVEIVNYKR